MKGERPTKKGEVSLEHNTNVVLELIIYTVLIVGYLSIVLKFFTAPLVFLFENKLIIYAIVALALIVGQGVILEKITRLLLEWIEKRGVN